ncbi:MAG: MotA/TolQ/ExbB proton channel family protein [Candidatus Methylacidiphilales bacterium]
MKSQHYHTDTSTRRVAWASALLLTITLGWLFSALHAQPEPTTREVVEQKQSEQQKDQSLWDLYLQGGVLMHVIALCSIGTISVAAYCGIQINGGKMAPKAKIAALNHMMAQRDVESAFQACRAEPGPLTNTLSSALVKANFEKESFNKPAMEQAAGETLVHEETRYMLWINYLNVFATIAPMIGLLGTVTGMIEAFNQLAAGRAEPDDLAGGIGVAMVTTAGGLIVGIPAMFCYFFFRNNLQGAMADIQKAVTNMLDLFTGEVSLE